MENNVLGTKSVKKLFLELSIPAVVAQIVNLAYNMVDRMYRASGGYRTYSFNGSWCDYADYHTHKCLQLFDRDGREPEGEHKNGRE